MLVCQRPPHKRHGGLWEFPGGKVGAGESDAEAGRRELREELGVNVIITSGPLFEVPDPGSDFTIAFYSVEIEGEPHCLEHTGVMWGTPAELLGLPLAPSDAAFVRSLLNHQHSSHGV